MSKRFLSLLVFSYTSLVLTSCSPSHQQPKIRVVDMQGNPHNVVTRSPELNSQYIQSQQQSAATFETAYNNHNLQQNNPSFDRKNTQNFRLINPHQTQIQPKILPRQSSISTDNNNYPQSKNLYNNNNINNATNNNAAEITEETFDTKQTATQRVKSEIDLTNNNSEANTANVVQYDLNESDQNEIDNNRLAEQNTNQSNQENRPVKAIRIFGNSNSNKKLSSRAAEKENKDLDSARKNGFYAQVGSFANQESAKAVLSNMQKFHSGIIETANGDKTLYRVLLGPVKDKKSASALVQKIKNSGHEAIVVK